MTSRLSSFAVIASASLFVANCGASNPQGNGTQEAWRPYDAPIQLDANFVRTLQALPTEGQLSKLPWPDTYWPSYEGGIAVRWNAGSQESFNYRSPTFAELRRMSSDQIAALSPAEKMDILNRRYDYPLRNAEWARTSPSRPTWEGLCHGWAPAAAVYDEPKPVVIRNADGISIPFGSSDIKALLIFNQGNYARPNTRFLGKRCNVDFNEVVAGRAEAEDCKGVNPGAFHIVLANQIGLKNQSFMADVTRDLEVWNHPVSAYRSSFSSRNTINRNAAPGTVREVLVQTTMYYSVETDPAWTTLGADSSLYTSRKIYTYTLELNRAGQIIGGEWISQDRPDFLWNQEAAGFYGYFTRLGTVYAQSVGISSSPIRR
jgi:hypothetical protein